jgi:hypothetical protein
MKKDKVKDFKFSRNPNKSYTDETDMKKDKVRDFKFSRNRDKAETIEMRWNKMLNTSCIL